MWNSGVPAFHCRYCILVSPAEFHLAAGPSSPRLPRSRGRFVFRHAGHGRFLRRHHFLEFRVLLLPAGTARALRQPLRHPCVPKEWVPEKHVVAAVPGEQHGRLTEPARPVGRRWPKTSTDRKGTGPRFQYGDKSYQQNGTDPQAAWQFRDAASLGARRRNIAFSSQHTLPFGALVVQAFALLVLDNLLHLVEGLLELPGARRLSRQVRPEFGGFLGQRVSLLADLRVLR